MKNTFSTLVILLFSISFAQITQAESKIKLVRELEHPEAEMVCGWVTTKSKPLHSSIKSAKKGTFLLVDADQYKAKILAKTHYNKREIKSIGKNTIRWCGCYRAKLDKANNRVDTVFTIMQLSLNTCKKSDEKHQLKMASNNLN